MMTSFCIVADQWTEKFSGKLNQAERLWRNLLINSSLSIFQGLAIVVYISLHHADENFCLLLFVLGCYPYDGESHSASHVRAFVDNKLADYNLTDSSKYVVTNNERKMQKLRLVKIAFVLNARYTTSTNNWVMRLIQQKFMWKKMLSRK